MLKGLNINPTLLKLPQMKDKKGSQRDTTHLFHPIPIVIDTPASSPLPPTINEAPQAIGPPLMTTLGKRKEVDAPLHSNGAHGDVGDDPSIAVVTKRARLGSVVAAADNGVSFFYLTHA